MCQKKHSHPRRIGATPADAAAHEQEHRLWTRRDFLSASGLTAAGGFLLGRMGLRAFQPSPLLAALSAGDPDRILVMIRLDGGNDGLNTVIQRGNNHYYNHRPGIAIQENQLWALNDDYGMPNSMASLEPLWQEGMINTVFNVGYPQPNYSHFRSYDIVASASDADEVWHSGWLGRFLDHTYPAFLETPPTVPPALQIGVQADLLFRSDQAHMALAVTSPEEFYQIAQSGRLYNTDNLGSSLRDQELLFVRQTANAAFRYAGTVQEAYANGQNAVSYPSGNPLAEQLAILARLIKGRLGTRIFMVQINGFDTHANQLDKHLLLLKYLADAVRAFYDDLAAGNAEWDKKVLSATYSEFGRTIFENISGGTDHGWGTHSLLFSRELGGGFFGAYPDLSNADPLYDPPFSVDFRSVYATLLGDWLGNPPELVRFVLGGDYPMLSGLVPPTLAPAGEPNACVLLGHTPHPNLPGVIEIRYALMRGGPVKLQVLDRNGQVLRILVDGVQEKGSYIFQLDPVSLALPPGRYQYRLLSGGQIFKRQLGF